MEASVGGDSARPECGGDIRLVVLPGLGDSKRRQDRPGRRPAVERVEVNPGRALAQKLGALLGGVGDAELELGLLVAIERLHRRSERCWDRRLAELAEAPDLR